MESVNDGLIIIFKTKFDSNQLEFYSAAKAKYIKSKQYYKIISGEFNGFTSDDFNQFIILGTRNPFDKEKIEKNPQLKPRFGFLNTNNSGDEIIYIFSPEYMFKYAFDNDLTFDEACIEVSMMAQKNIIKFYEKFESLKKDVFYEYTLDTKKESIDKDILIGMLDCEATELMTSQIEEIPPQIEKNQLQIEETFKIEGLRDKVNSMIEEIRKKIVGQDEAIVTLVTNIFYNQLLIEELCNGYDVDLAQLDSRKVGILLDGSTGTGKTAILKDIASKLDLPLCFSNANSFSETGYVGPSITDVLRKLYIISGRDVKKAERGIVVLDEIDKLASNVTAADGINMKKGVQEELLGFISGGEYDFPLEDKFGSPTIHFDTSKLTFILSGAFTNLRERKIKEEKKKNNSIGFGYKESEKKDNTYTITAQDYVDEGLNREFFGRIKVLTCTKTYTFDDLKTILLTSTISPLKNLERTVIMFGYPGITYTDDFIDDVCTQAFEMKTGARGLQTIMSGIQNRLLMGLISQSYDLDKPIELSINLLNDYNKSLVRRY